MENKPFVFGVETSEEHFTDREKDRKSGHLLMPQ